MTKPRRTQARGKQAAGPPGYRRSPFLVSYWLGPVLVFENYTTRQRVAGDSFFCDLLAFCDGSRSFAEICSKFPEEKPSAILDGIHRLQKYSLLQTSSGKRRDTNDAMRGWEKWSPSASHFHFATKDAKYEQSDVEDFSSLRQLAKRRPLPAQRKQYPGVKRVKLSIPGSTGEFNRVLRERRTWREFSREPLDLRRLELLLWLSFGVQAWAKVPGVGRLPLKTSPSGGALHPIEAYVLIRNVRGIAPGIYHYDDEGHRLELLRAGCSRAEIKKLLVGQDWFCGSPIVVFLTAVFQRCQWKYEHPRAYRVVLAEAGHVCQTFCLTATWLGLAPFCTMALADTKIEQVLGVDGITESVVYAMGAGLRPKRAATADRLRQTTGRF
jgi:SagB-type dehydrogenase family enzyme